MRIILHYNRRNLQKAAPVEYEVYLSRHDRVYISTKVLIEQQYWDKKAGEVSHKHKDAFILNLKIKALKQRLDEIIRIYQQSGETLTGVILRSHLTDLPPAITLNEYMARQIEVDRATLKESTYRRLKSVLRNFNQFRQVPLMQCDTNLIREYHNFLLRTMQQSTTGKNHKVISKYLRRAQNEGLIKQNPYINFKIPAYATRRVYLTASEIEQIRSKHISIERLAVVRDMFLFMCNSGMEYIDMMQLPSDNNTTIKEKFYIVKSRVKVQGEIQAIPLFPEALEIITKYNTGTGYIFPRRSNQKLNSYLSELADLCGITKPLSTIIARHTFATNMLNKGMPLESLSHILGHSNARTTRIYAKMIVSKIENDLSRLGITGV